MRLLLKLICAIAGGVIGIVATALLMELMLGIKYNPVFGAPVALLLGAIGWRLPGKQK